MQKNERPAVSDGAPEATDNHTAPTLSATIVTMSKPEARRLTDCIKNAIAAAWDLIAQAYNERAWTALGYTSWDDYCTNEFGSSRLRLPREERAEVVGSLRESGLSLRAIEAATGFSRPTIIKDIAAAEVVKSLPPDPPGGVTETTPGQTDRVAAALAAARAKQDDVDPVEPIMAKITGTDGKSYPKPAVAAKPRRWPLSNDAAKISLEFSRVINRMQKLVDDDRFAANRDSIARQFRPYLSAALDVMNRLNDVVDEPLLIDNRPTADDILMQSEELDRRAMKIVADLFTDLVDTVAVTQ